MTDVGTGLNGTLRMTASESSYDAAANTSVVAWALYLIENNSSVYSSYNASVGSNSVVVDGTTRWSGSFGFDWRPAGIQTTLIASGSTSVAHNADGTKSLNVTGNMGATGTSGAGGPTSATQSLTLTTLLLAPAVPTGLSVTRVSDTSQTVAWTNNPATRAPVTGTKVRRRDNVDTAWVVVAPSLDAVGSWTDNSTAGNREYEYEVASTNSAGSSAWTPAGFIKTTPAAATSCAAAKSGTDIVVTWVNNATAADAIQMQASQNGGAWADLGAPISAALETVSHNALAGGDPNPAVTWAYRVVAKTTTPALSATSVESNTVQLLTAPNAPTGLGPSTVADATEPMTLVWQHNPVDTTDQTKRQLRYRVQGSPTWIEQAAVTSSVKAITLTPSTDLSIGNTNVLEWGVRTWGSATSGGSDGTGASPYSATATRTLSARPTGTTSAPADASTVASSKVAVAWAYYDAEGTAQAAWKVELINSLGAVVETKTGVGATASTTMATTVPDASSWSVRVTVTDGSGMTSTPDTVAFTVAYALPPVPTLEATWSPNDGATQLTITNPAPTGAEIAAVSNNIYRRRDGGSWVLLYEGVPINTSILDWAPTVAGLNEYKIEAVSALPSIATSSVSSVTTPEVGDPPGSLWLSVGAGFSTVCRATKNVKITALPKLTERVVKRYAGRPSGMEISGTNTTRRWMVSFELIPRGAAPVGSTPAEWEAMGVAAGPFLLRDNSPLYVRCSVYDLSVRRSTSGDVHYGSFIAEEVGNE